MCGLLLEYDLFGIPEWESWQNGNTVMHSYSPERWRGVNALYVREQWVCMDLYIGINDEATENLSISIRQQTNIDNIIVNVRFWSLSQEEKIKRPSLKIGRTIHQQNLVMQILASSRAAAGTAEQGTWIQELSEDHCWPLFTQGTDEPMAADALLDLTQERKSRDVKVWEALAVWDGGAQDPEQRVKCKIQNHSPWL